MTIRDRWRRPHGPTCTCSVCAEARKRGITRDRYLQELSREAELSQSFTASSAMSEADEILNKGRMDGEAGAPEPLSGGMSWARIQEAKERLARGETIHVETATDENHESDDEASDSSSVDRDLDSASFSPTSALRHSRFMTPLERNMVYGEPVPTVSPIRQRRWWQFWKRI